MLNVITRSVILVLVFVSTCVYSWVVVMCLSFLNTMQVTLFLYLFYIIVYTKYHWIMYGVYHHIKYVLYNLYI